MIGDTGEQRSEEDPIHAERKRRAYVSLFASNVALSYRNLQRVLHPRQPNPPSPLPLRSLPAPTQLYIPIIPSVLKSLLLGFLTVILSPHENHVFFALIRVLRSCLRSRAALQAENIALRHQITVLQRNRKRLRLNSGDRFFWSGCPASGQVGVRHWQSLIRKQLSVGIAKDFVSTGPGKAEVRRSGAG